MKNIVSKPVPQLPIESNDPEALKIKTLVDQIQKQKQKLKHLEPQLKLYEEKRKSYDQLKELSKKVKLKSALVLSTEMKAYNRVIKRVGLVDKGVITLKGRVTC